VIVPDPIDPIHDLDPLRRAPVGDECTRECHIGEVDRETIVHDASCACATRSLAEGEARRRRGPPIGTTIGVEPCDDLVEAAAESLRRDCDPDPHRKPALGLPSGLLYVAVQAQLSEALQAILKSKSGRYPNLSLGIS